MSETDVIQETQTPPCGYSNGMLRYIVPFYISERAAADSADHPYEWACGCFDGARDGGHGRWEPVTDYQFQRDVYEHIAHWMAPRQTSLEIGRSWLYAPFERDGHQRPDIGWWCEDQHIMPVQVTRLGVSLFASGIGFLWYELQRSRKEALAGEDVTELFAFSNQFKKLSYSGVPLLDLGSPSILVTEAELSAMAAGPEDEAVELLDAEGGKLNRLRRQALRDWLRQKNEKLPMRLLEGQIGETYYRLPVSAGGSEAGWQLLRRRPEMGLWLQELLTSTCEGVSFFVSARKDGPRTVTVPDKALVFGYLATDIADADGLRDAVCRLARGYSMRYDFSRTQTEDALELFRQTMIYAGHEGCGIISGRGAAEFYQGGFLQNAKAIYFWIYMLALQQLYGAINFSRRIAQELPTDPNAYLVDDEHDGYAGVMDRLLLAMNAFLIKNDFGLVSGTHHQNEYYQYIRRRLSIAENTENLYSGLRALSEMQQNRLRAERQRRLEEEQKRERERAEELRAREKQEDDQARRRESRMNRALGAIAFFTVVSALTDAFALVRGIGEIIPRVKASWTWTPVSVTLVALLAALVVGIITVFVTALTIYLRSARRDDRPKPTKTETL